MSVLDDTVRSVTAVGAPMQRELERIDFLLVTPHREVREAVRARLPRCEPVPGEVFAFHRGTLPYRQANGRECRYSVAVVSPAGTGDADPAALVAAAGRRWRFNHVVLIGIAGGTTPGDVLIADRLAGLSVDGALLSWVREFHPPADGPAWNSRSVPRPGAGTPQVRFGPANAKANPAEDQPLIGVAAAMDAAPHRAGVFVVRAISDPANQWRAYAVEVAAAYSVAFLASGPVPSLEESAASRYSTVIPTTLDTSPVPSLGESATPNPPPPSPPPPPPSPPPAAERRRRTGGNPWLAVVVTVERATTYSVEGWYFAADGRPEVRVEAAKTGGWKRAKLGAALAALWRSGHDDHYLEEVSTTPAGAAGDLHVEVYLPNDLITFRTAEVPVQVNDRERPLGDNHPLVHRHTDRWRSQGHKSARVWLKQRCDGRAALLTEPLRLAPDGPGHADDCLAAVFQAGRRVMNDHQLRETGLLCAVLCDPLPDEPADRRQFDNAYDAGLPAVLWVRGESSPAPDPPRHLLEQLFDGTTFDTLPAVLFRHRVERGVSLAEGELAFVRRLGLIHEHPDRVPDTIAPSSPATRVSGPKGRKPK